MVYDGAMQGLHLTADLYKCHCADAWLLDPRQLGDWVAEAVRAAGLQPASQLFHSFAGTGGSAGGVAATVLLAEAHVCVHTWPARRAATLDVYVCNFSGDGSTAAHRLMTALVERFLPEWTEQRSLDRGDGE